MGGGSAGGGLLLRAANPLHDCAAAVAGRWMTPDARSCWVTPHAIDMWVGGGGEHMVAGGRDKAFTAAARKHIAAAAVLGDPRPLDDRAAAVVVGGGWVGSVVVPDCGRNPSLEHARTRGR